MSKGINYKMGVTDGFSKIYQFNFQIWYVKSQIPVLWHVRVLEEIQETRCGNVKSDKGEDKSGNKALNKVLTKGTREQDNKRTREQD